MGLASGEELLMLVQVRVVVVGFWFRAGKLFSPVGEVQGAFRWVVKIRGYWGVWGMARN